MSLPIEDYALIGNRHTAALVGRNGSIDWLCVPRYDSPACFAAILGCDENGRWLIAPQTPVKRVHRKYRGNTLVLETTFETDDGVVALIDFMPLNETTGRVDLIRIVEGREGSVPMRMELVLRFDYGEIIPTLTHQSGGMRAIGGPDAVLLQSPIATHSDGVKTQANFVISKGETFPFTFIRNDSCLPPPAQAGIPLGLLHETEEWWTDWASHCVYEGPYRDEVLRSLLTLKALTFRPSGASVAAPTTSLPERTNGSLNWDYRYCWLRDASFTLCALLECGYSEEVIAWREWLMRTVAGRSQKLQSVYGLAGERRLTEFELSPLPGYEGSKPVRIGNAAYKQLQLDVYGEILSALYIAHRYHLKIDQDVWLKHCEFLFFLEKAWDKPDDGIWETRGGPRHFTQSKVAAWVAFDRAVKLIEGAHLVGPLKKWRDIRDKIHRDVCARGYDRRRHSFVQSYGSTDLDAALLMLPLRGFLPPDDPRIVGTVEAIQRELMEGGLLKRFRHTTDGGEEGAFLPCTFWLVDCLVAMGRRSEALKIFERLLGLCNDVGLLSEEFDCSERRQLGNFPQALTHIALINSALNLSPGHIPLNVFRAE